LAGKNILLIFDTITARVIKNKIALILSWDARLAAKTKTTIKNNDETNTILKKQQREPAQNQKEFK
jgi:hypothetical protein